MKTELNQQGNQYEIVEFVNAQTRFYLGLDKAPDTVSALREDSRSKSRRAVDDPNEEVEELPDKVCLTSAS